MCDPLMDTRYGRVNVDYITAEFVIEYFDNTIS